MRDALLTKYAVAGRIHKYTDNGFDCGVWDLEIFQLGITVSCLDPLIDLGRDYPSKGDVTGTLEFEFSFVYPVTSTVKALKIYKRSGPTDGDLLCAIGSVIERFNEAGESPEYVGDFGVPVVFRPNKKTPELALGSSIFLKSCLFFYPVSFGEINVAGLW